MWRTFMEIQQFIKWAHLLKDLSDCLSLSWTATRCWTGLRSGLWAFPEPWSCFGWSRSVVDVEPSFRSCFELIFGALHDPLHPDWGSSSCWRKAAPQLDAASVLRHGDAVLLMMCCDLLVKVQPRDLCRSEHIILHGFGGLVAYFFAKFCEAWMLFLWKGALVSSACPVDQTIFSQWFSLHVEAPL